MTMLHTPEKIYATAAGQLLRSARTRQGVTQFSLAQRAGTSQRHISRIERGEVSPSVDTLARLLAGVGEELRLELAPAGR